MVLGEHALPVRSELAVDDARNVMRLSRNSVLMERPTAEFGTSTMASTPSTSSHLRAMALPTSALDRKSTRLNSSHVAISYAVFCLKKKKKKRYASLTRIKKKRIKNR